MKTFCPFCNCIHDCIIHSKRERKTGENQELQVVICPEQKDLHRKGLSTSKGFFTIYPLGYAEYTRRPLVDFARSGQKSQPKEDTSCDNAFFKKLWVSHENPTPIETRSFKKSPIDDWRNSVFFPVLSYAFGIRWGETMHDFHIPESEWNSTFPKDEFFGFVQNLGQNAGVRNTQNSAIKRLFTLIFTCMSGPGKPKGFSIKSELKPLVPISESLIDRMFGEVSNSVSIGFMAKVTTLALKVLVPSISLWQELRILWRKRFPIFNE